MHRLTLYKNLDYNQPVHFTEPTRAKIFASVKAWIFKHRKDGADGLCLDGHDTDSNHLTYDEIYDNDPWTVTDADGNESTYLDLPKAVRHFLNILEDHGEWT